MDLLLRCFAVGEREESLHIMGNAGETSCNAALQWLLAWFALNLVRTFNYLLVEFSLD